MNENITPIRPGVDPLAGLLEKPTLAKGPSKATPLRDKIVVYRQKQSDMRGGLYLPSTADRYVYTASAVGPQVTGVKVGDILLINANPASLEIVAVEPDDDDTMLISESDVWGVK